MFNREPFATTLGPDTVVHVHGPLLLRCWGAKASQELEPGSRYGNQDWRAGFWRLGMSPNLFKMKPVLTEMVLNYWAQSLRVLKTFGPWRSLFREVDTLDLLLYTHPWWYELSVQCGLIGAWNLTFQNEDIRPFHIWKLRTRTCSKRRCVVWNLLNLLCCFTYPPKRIILAYLRAKAIGRLKSSQFVFLIIPPSFTTKKTITGLFVPESYTTSLSWTLFYPSVAFLPWSRCMPRWGNLTRKTNRDTSRHGLCCSHDVFHHSGSFYVSF